MVTLYLILVLYLSLTFKPGTGFSCATRSGLIVSNNRADRLPLPKRTQVDLDLLHTHSDAARPSIAHLHEHVGPRQTYAVNNSAELCSMKALTSSELQCRHCNNVCDRRSISLTDSGLKSFIQSVTTRFVENVVTGLSELSMSLRSSLLITAMPKSLMQIEFDSIDKQGSAFGVNVPHGHNLGVKSNATKYDHQSIVVMEDDPVVIDSASFLFEKHPSVSTLLRFHKGALEVLRGFQTRMTGQSRVVLVGHRRKGRDGVSTLGGYGPEELCRVVTAMEIEDGRLQTLSLVGCELGKDLRFAERLLRALRSLRVETKLHLHSSALSVSPSGQKVTREEEGVWRHKDGRNKVIAELDQSGKLLTRVEKSKRGRVVPDYTGHALFIETLEWPTHPQMFVPEDLRKKYPSIDCLEGLTWSLFFEENERRRAPDYTPGDGQNLSAVWVSDHEPEGDVPIKHLATILDLLMEIRYNGWEDADLDLYYVLNDCIYKVQRITFHVFLVGRYIDPHHRDEREKFTDTFKDQKESYSIQELRQGLKAAEFNDFCRQTFQLRRCLRDCERWGHYFMAAVFSASVRNFRTFSLFLMSVIACEVGRSQGSDSSLCTAFVGEDHPMATADPWPERGRRGFYGCTVDKSEEMRKRDRLVWLDQVVAKENALFSHSKKMMSGVDHDQETELDIFGRVKVMNKYAFSSYLEFFRGTPEGKKLARGCMGPRG